MGHGHDSSVVPCKEDIPWLQIEVEDRFVMLNGHNQLEPTFDDKVLTNQESQTLDNVAEETFHFLGAKQVNRRPLLVALSPLGSVGSAVAFSLHTFALFGGRPLKGFERSDPC